MQRPSSKDNIYPFSPSAFPPRSLKTPQFSLLLKKANQALETYAHTLSQLPHPHELLTSLDILEAIGSLDSQEISTTLKECLANKSSPTDKNTKKLAPIEDYLKGIAWLQKHKNPFGKKAFCTLHKIVKAATSPTSDLGRYRRRQNWIGPKNCLKEDAYFYPPAPNKVETLMQELFAFAALHKKEPLVQLALIFNQLLIIHPFMDGNGRIARILIPTFLCNKGKIPTPHFYFSSYFTKHRLRYFRTLFQTTYENNWEDWIVFFLRGVLIRSRQQKKHVEKTADLYKRMNKELPSLNIKTRLFLFKNPLFTRSSFRKAGGAPSDLEILIRKKWVRLGPESIYCFSSLLKLLPKK